jgi:hypothetical protein
MLEINSLDTPRAGAPCFWNAIPHNLLWTILWDGIPDVLEMSKLTIGQ